LGKTRQGDSGIDLCRYYGRLGALADPTEEAEYMQLEQTRDPVAANIPRYFVYTALKGLSFGLVTATWVIYLQWQHGLNLTQVTLVDIAFWIAATLSELPTGIVADRYGRKTSLVVGVAMMAASILVWAVAPNVLIIILAYASLAIGATFLSGAEDAFFFESLQVTRRASEYTRLVGRVSATMLAAIAIGNLSSGLLATLNLRLPFIASGLVLLTMLGIVLTFKEPQSEGRASGQHRMSYAEILKQSYAILRTRPPLRYAMAYLVVVPVSAVVLETVFLQPQAIALGIPVAGVGIVVMAAQFTSMAGSTSSHRLKDRFGEAHIILIAPWLIVVSLLLLAAFQVVPALLFAAVISFVTALLRPILMTRIQNEVADSIRATVLSMQSLIFALLLTFVEPLLGYAADQASLSAAYVVLATGLGILLLVLYWKGRQRFP
jgi:MFS family permease